MMKKTNINIMFDIKSMGISFFVPIILSVLIIIYFISISKPFITLEIAIPLMEYLFIPFSCWWSLYLFYDYYEDQGSEVFFSYPLTKSEHGLLRVTVFLLIYLVLLIIVLIVLDFFHTDFLFVKLFLQFVPQIVFFSSLGVFLVNSLKSFMFSISLISIYVTTEFLTKGSFLPIYHPFFSNTEPYSIVELASKGILNLILGVILFKASYYFLKFRP